MLVLFGKETTCDTFRDIIFLHKYITKACVGDKGALIQNSRLRNCSWGGGVVFDFSLLTPKPIQ